MNGNNAITLSNFRTEQRSNSSHRLEDITGDNQVKIIVLSDVTVTLNWLLTLFSWNSTVSYIIVGRVIAVNNTTRRF